MKKIGNKFALGLAIGATTMLMNTTGVYALAQPFPGITSTGAISYDNNGDGVEETLLDSKDLKSLSSAIDTATTEQSQYAKELAQLKKELAAYQKSIDESNNTLSVNKANLVSSLQTKFKGDAKIDALKSTSSFADIKAAVDGIVKTSVSGAINGNDGYTVSIPAKKYTGDGSSVTVNKAAVTGAAQSDGTFKYSIAAKSYTGANGSSGSIAKLTPTYSSGSTQTAVKAGGTVTLPAGTYNKDKVTITAASLASQTPGTATADHILSGKTAWVNGSQVSGNIGNASVSGAINSNDGYTVSIPAKKYTGAGSSVTVAKGAVSGAVNTNDGYTASIAAGKYTGAKGSSVTVNKASVTGAAQSDGTFKYSIAAKSYTGANGSSGSIAKLTPTYSSGSTQTAVKAGGTVTLPAGTYNKDKVTITAASLASQTSGTAKASDMLSGTTAWVNGSKVTGSMAVHQYDNATTVGYYKDAANEYGHVHFHEGYYGANGASWAPEIRLTKSQIKDLANAAGFSANVTYTVTHTHGYYCDTYQPCAFSDIEYWDWWYDDYGNANGYQGWKTSGKMKCSVCNTEFSAGNGQYHNYDELAALCWQDAAAKGHSQGGMCPNSRQTCGKPAGTYTTTDPKKVGAGDTVTNVSVVLQ